MISRPHPRAEPMIAPPILAEVTRGDMVESRHRGSLAVIDAKGRVLEALGEIGTPIYPRSAIKPLQAIVLVESGAAERFQVSDREVALASASHNGEPMHVDAVRAWLQRIELSEADLECGVQLPSYTEVAHRLIRSGIEPSQLHNNCSGKHTGFLTVARHLGVPTKGYINPDHPVQRALLALFEELCEANLRQRPRGRDGCSIPVFGVSLTEMARALAHLADPTGLSPGRAAACRRVVAAVAANPLMIAGTGRFDSKVIAACRGRILVKGGAEGVHAAALPEKGIGVAIKIEDGAGRASGIAMGQALVRLGALSREEAASLADEFTPTLRNWVGTPVGQIHPASDAAF
ncbi:MAG: asparaginase [Proteobacteria bacterium]|nr:asparaginase [Pseudomonadota bacterium]MBI3499542.1 asparaginase [Pseudomonadota bacterium]